jgi:hypothetical protein
VGASSTRKITSGKTACPDEAFIRLDGIAAIGLDRVQVHREVDLVRSAASR